MHAGISNIQEKRTGRTGGMRDEKACWHCISKALRQMEKQILNM